MERRKALLVGAGRFASPVAAGEEPPTGAALWPPLDFVYDVLPGVAGALGDLGYEVTRVLDPDAAALRDAFGHAVDEGCGIVHVLSHGDIDPQGDRDRLDVVPSCTRVGNGTNVSEWLSTVEKLRSPTLFLLDLCHAGRAARLPFLQEKAGRDTAAWVIAAAGRDEYAYDGRFSEAVTEVLAEVARTGLDTHPSQRHVAFSVVARAIGLRVSGPDTEAAGRLSQTVCSTPLDPALPEPELPFFPNPRYLDDPALRARQTLDRTLRGFVDDLPGPLPLPPTTDQPSHTPDPSGPESPDVAHFADRAGSHFTGRRGQLRHLVGWLDGGDGALCVVTGSPGAGKSALLGALVCAAHPQAAAAAPHVRARLQGQDPAGCPSYRPGLVALHARQRALPEITASLARQLRLVPPGSPGEVPGPEDLVAAVAALDEPPSIIVDAVDEALDPAGLTTRLLLPLADARRAGGRPACRLLVGMRPWQDFAPLRQRAAAEGHVIDLDTVSQAELRADLSAHLAGVLSDLPGYRSARRRVVRGRLAEAVAARLTRPADVSRPWGAFLVASLFVRHLAVVSPAVTVAEAETLGSRVPATLPEVLELDLRARPDGALHRTLLTVLAHAKGQGMPAELVAAVAGADPGAVRTLLHADLRPYLRTEPEQDGTTLHRLFHQGLADHLRQAAPLDEGTVLDRLTAPYRAPRGGVYAAGTWQAAPPYLYRHAIEHAAAAGRADELLTDPELLVHGATDAVLAACALAGTPHARAAADVYRASVGSHRHTDTEARRQLLAVDAARFRVPALLAALTEPLEPARWRPRWATGTQVSPALRNSFRAGPVDALACTQDETRPLVVTGGSDGTVSVWDLATGRRTHGPLPGHTGRVLAVACTRLRDGRPVAVSADSETLLVWDLASGLPLGKPLTGSAGRMRSLACARIAGRSVAVTAGRDAARVRGVVEVWDLDAGRRCAVATAPDGDTFRTVACTEVEGRPMAVAGGDGALWRWELEDSVTDGGRLRGSPLAGSAGGVNALACGERAGRPVAVASGEGALRIWDLADGGPVGSPLTGRAGGVNAVACARPDGGTLAVTTSFDGSVEAWDLTAGRPLGAPMTAHVDAVTSIACTRLDGRAVAVQAGGEGTVRVWDLERSPLVSGAGTGHAREVTSLASARTAGRTVVVSAGYDGARVWDMAADRPRGVPLSEHISASAVVCAVVGGDPVGVTGSHGGRIQMWDLTTGLPLGRPLRGDADSMISAACAVVGGRPVAVVGSGRAVRTWDLTDQAPCGAPMRGHTRRITAVACTVIEDRPAAVSVARDGTLRVWDLAARKQWGDPLRVAAGEGDREVTAVGCVWCDGVPVAVAGDGEGTVRGWDLVARRPVGPPLGRHDGAVTAIACGLLDGRPVAASGGVDRTVRIWDLRRGHAVVHAMPEPVGAVVITADGALVAGTGQELVVLERGVGAR
ncbi:hypothetical protein ABZ707_31000 [Streptomyces sp. NPDC006923]|uniref:hypothetical protein n=1 Tax=Streptomyces sp. NPDC006923 TaxID=3155355 RepID=UPI003402BFD0